MTSLLGQVALSCKPQDPAFASKTGRWESDTAMRSLCTSRQFPLSYVFKFRGNNPSIKVRPTTWRWAKVQLKGKKNMFLYQEIFLPEQAGNSFVVPLLESSGTWKRGKHMSNRRAQITSFPQQRKSGWFCFPSWVEIIGTKLKGLWLKPSSGEVTLPNCAGNARLHISSLPRSGSMLCLYSVYSDFSAAKHGYRCFVSISAPEQCKTISPRKKKKK